MERFFFVLEYQTLLLTLQRTYVSSFFHTVQSVIEVLSWEKRVLDCWVAKTGFFFYFDHIAN